MEQVVIALLMMINNEIKEARIQSSLSDCLRGKRHAMRGLDSKSKVSYSCIKSLAELEQNIDGSWSIKKLIME